MKTPTHEFTLWATYSCPAEENETFEQWYERAQKEYQESFHPDDNSLIN